MTHVHLIGIGGSGLSAIARFLKESGYTVSGSDRSLTPLAARLQAEGVTIYLGHHPRHIQGADWVVRSSAVPEDNPEVLAARQAGIPVYKRADLLGRLMEGKFGIAVAGTHGKTTTTAMIAFLLSELGRDPSFIVGGVMNNYHVNARAGQGRFFVLEADEYDRTFLGLQPRLEVITNVEHDHPDCYPTYGEMLAAFEAFVGLLPADGMLIACAEDAGAAALLNRARRAGQAVMAYGIQGEMTINAPQWMQGRALQPNARGGFDFRLLTNVGKVEAVAISLQVPGEHNVRNALAALATTVRLGLPLEEAASALERFRGTARRFEVRGERKGVIVIDDYAHHPSEIRATLAAARARYPQHRLWAVWQPHTYSRTQALFHEFRRAFQDADQVIVTEVYAAREAQQAFSAAEVVRGMPHPAARFMASLEEATRYLLKHLRRNDVLLVLSAGDAERISADVLAQL